MSRSLASLCHSSLHGLLPLPSQLCSGSHQGLHAGTGLGKSEGKYGLHGACLNHSFIQETPWECLLSVSAMLGTFWGSKRVLHGCLQEAGPGLSQMLCALWSMTAAVRCPHLHAVVPRWPQLPSPEGRELPSVPPAVKSAGSRGSVPSGSSVFERKDSRNQTLFFIWHPPHTAHYVNVIY